MTTFSLKRLGFIPLLTVAMLAGCGNKEKEDRDFFTSGDREADQRGEQVVAKSQQLRGESGDGNNTNARKSLYDRLGGEEGLKKIVDDFLARAIADPRVNWERKGVKSGGGLLSKDKPREWQPSGENLQRLKTHLVQFLSLATGGPAQYGGREMKEVHKGMEISNIEFNATIGDMKATLDHLGVPTDEQKELLAVLESVREQVVEKK